MQEVYCVSLGLSVLGLLLTIAGCSPSGESPQGTPSASVVPADMPRVGTVDERSQSYNVEMLEVTGGDFWKPYDDGGDSGINAQESADTARSSVPAGMDPSMYQYRPPIDLTNARLRKLAAALGPAYVRVSGTWANTTYFHDSGDPAPETPPEGFNGVLTRQQWRSVVDFARAVDAEIVTSFATGPGTRDAAGVWTPAEAQKFLAYMESLGENIAAAEFMNEPTIAAMGGAPEGYDAETFGRDLAVFIPFVKKTVPDMLIVGPGSVGEGGPLSLPAAMEMLTSEGLLRAAGSVFDVFSYHYYGAVSERCASAMPELGTTAEAALSEEWLSGTEETYDFYAGLRDEFMPGKPIWVTETADAACGSNSWGSTFLDSFRYLDQMGRLSKRGVQVVMHNTLAASDYGLLDEDTFAPRPNYWAALLWKRLMGTTVLDAGPPPDPSLHLYAHCLPGEPGGVTLLAINTNRATPQSIEIPTMAERYTLTAKDLEDGPVQLNGSELQLGADDAFPSLAGTPAKPGQITFAPATVTFLAMPDANNPACR